MPSACVLSCRLPGRTWCPPSLSKSTMWAGAGLRTGAGLPRVSSSHGAFGEGCICLGMPTAQPPGASAGSREGGPKTLHLIPWSKAPSSPPSSSQTITRCPIFQFSSDTVHPPPGMGWHSAFHTWTLLNILDIKTQLSSFMSCMGLWIHFL